MDEALDSQSVARRSFSVARRGYEQQEVRAFLHEVSSLLDRVQREAAAARERADHAEARLGVGGQTDEAMLMEVLGEETTRVLTSAREAAAEIRSKADTTAARVIGDATSDAATIRGDAVRDAEARLAEARRDSDSMLEAARAELERRSAEGEAAASRLRDAAAQEAQTLREEGQRELERGRAEAEAEVAAARDRGREMVGEAQAVRERVLRDLAVRRKRARQQVEKLNAGRERLLQAYDVVRSTVDEATDELNVALADARTAADAASRRVEEEADPSLEELDREVATAAVIHPIAPPAPDGGADDPGTEPGPVSGEVPAVEDQQVVATPGDEPHRRARRGRRRKGFEGLPPGELTKLSPPSEAEGVRVLGAEAEEPEGDGAETVEAEADETATTEPEAAAEGDGIATVDPGEADAQGDAAAKAEPEAEPGAPAAEAAEGEASVDELFARLRAEADEPQAAAPDETSSSDAAGDEPTEAEPADVEEPTPFTERDAALAPIDKELGRRLKRVLADEQNEVLDLLRRAKPKGVDDLLPDPAAHAARWSGIATGPLQDAAALAPGAKRKVGVADLADGLATTLTAPLRERIDRSFGAADGDLDDVADRVRALYREWKGQRLTDAATHATAASYARGAYEALAGDAQVRWFVDARREPCPDCDDNVLAGAQVKGEPFPTGQPCAPAHPGCRCLVLSAT